MKTFTDYALIAGAAVLGIAALWHFYWAFGGTKGLRIAIPEMPASKGGGPAFKPSAFATVVVASAILAIAGIFAAMATSAFNGSAYEGWIAILTGALGLVFVARAIGDFNHVGFFKRNRASPFAVADSRYYSPLCLFLGSSGLMAAAIHFL